MSTNKLYYLFHSGKNTKVMYYFNSYRRMFTPPVFFRMMRKRLLSQVEKRQDKDYILQRVDYYNKLTSSHFQPLKKEWEKSAVTLLKQPATRQKVYYHDSMNVAHYFPLSKKWILLDGDITYVPKVPSIVKSRPVDQENTNSILLKLNKIRHYIFVRDKKPWSEKKDVAIFRGRLGKFKENRTRFMELFGEGQSPMVDAAAINTVEGHPLWQKEKLTIREHFDYKFIMALEGNDVASNLKWVMYSNSIAVMPRPTQETWFMEGTLIPNYHYIEVKTDFSDVEERLSYYINHPKEAEAIIQHAHEYTSQFLNRKRELLISLLVLKKYFDITN